MSLLNLFKKKEETQGEELLVAEKEVIIPEVPKELFIEEKETQETTVLGSSIYNLDRIYAFASKDFEEKGYDDALILSLIHI